MGSKYNNRKMTAPDGQKFDSVKEYHRWGCLRLLERAGAIKDLKRQVKYELVPKIGDQRPCNYIADFTYIEDGKLVVEDCKGVKTEVYKLKKKLMLWIYGIRIKET